MKVNHKIRWTGKEAVLYRNADLECDVECYFDPVRKTFTAVLSDEGLKEGKVVQLSSKELAEVEAALKSELGVNRILGIPISRREVYVQRHQREV